ncbi:hypothetical protein CVT24_007879 [Panaeolus cyanescens]|uniref:Uncharacterized protein n=1 Tax=Panaeolus cyanescens TaxID=181874 RepID=A0A409X5B9_9AGAR|nr:hypothetical protein CVT24_007879 [Panaeolus cyanescens]
MHQRIKYTHDSVEVIESKPLEGLTLAERMIHNESAPINRLHAELLSTIFALLAESWPNNYIQVDSQGDGSNSKQHLVELNWARVSHICRQWRNVALGHSSLWTDIHLDSPKWAQLQMQQCRGSPLKLISNGPLSAEGKIPLNLALTSKFKQLKRVSLLINDEETSQQVANVMFGINSLAPNLESLSLIRLNLPVVDLGMHQGEVSSFNDLLGGGSPRLHSLDLAFVNFSWTSPTLTGLTSLMLASPLQPGQ